MCLYINSWRFTKLALCPDEYNHFWDYCFISQLRLLFASESSGLFLVTRTYSGSVCTCCFIFPCQEVNSYRLQFCVSWPSRHKRYPKAEAGQNSKLWILRLLNYTDLTKCFGKTPLKLLNTIKRVLSCGIGKVQRSVPVWLTSVNSSKTDHYLSRSEEPHRNSSHLHTYLNVWKAHQEVYWKCRHW